ncbi:unnamed protein product, partial [marine sediment metagenome]
GIMRVAKAKINKIFAPFHLIFVRLYATSEHEIVAPKILKTHIINVFRKYFKKGK